MSPPRPPFSSLLAALLLGSALLAGGCASRSAGAGKAPASRGDQLGAAATSPLNDFNVMQLDIPPVLLAAKARPYATPAKLECAPMLADVMALDAALGPDVDAPSATDGRSLADTGTEAVGDAAVGAFRSTVENLVPFRGWVRRLSGADQHERDIAAALAAGMARRAYIKGLMYAHGCLKMGEKVKADAAADAAARPAAPAPAPAAPPAPPTAPAVVTPVAPSAMDAQPPAQPPVAPVPPRAPQ